MCLGIPLRIVSAQGTLAIASDGARTERIDLSLTGPQAPGTWVLVFLGSARQVLDEDEAQRIRAALGGLQALMRGEDPGDAFADIEARAPVLPPSAISLDPGEV